MAALDRFGGPESWDLYCYEQDMRREAELDSAKCLDCDHCIRCEVTGHEDVGYCRSGDFWVTDEDTPRSVECEEYEHIW